MPRTQSSYYPPGRSENKIKEGGLWHAAQQNKLLQVSKKLIQEKPSKNRNQRLIKKLIIIALVLDILALIQIML
ncbi:hypothetical protein D3C87_755790 [compost metagenome]